MKRTRMTHLESFAVLTWLKAHEEIAKSGPAGELVGLIKESTGITIHEKTFTRLCAQVGIQRSQRRRSANKVSAEDVTFMANMLMAVVNSSLLDVSSSDFARLSQIAGHGQEA